MPGKKKKLKLAGKARVASSKNPPSRIHAEERRARKLERRKKEKKSLAQNWAAPAPSHLVAKLDLPKLKSKHQSYFEFADNPERKQKKLEFEITNKPPPPGFVFVPIGDPVLTNACKELSRDKDAMIFIVSGHKQAEENSKIAEHVHRTGYYYRETIVEEAKAVAGETLISNSNIPPGTAEPIPELQEDINKQADAAIRDLFPRIPNPDRVMIIEQSFQKGALFHGEPTVGLQRDIPLSRRVQLAVLAHIRHTHTRYDKLLRETSWMNARKAVEPVCLDILIKWRGDEETGRDQMDEILREVVIITDSEDEGSSDDDSSEEEGEITSANSSETSSPLSSQDQYRVPLRSPRDRSTGAPAFSLGRTNSDAISSRTRAKDTKQKEQRGFKRYQAAWEDALNRRHALRIDNRSPYDIADTRRLRMMTAQPAPLPYHPTAEASRTNPASSQHWPPGSLGEVNFSHAQQPDYFQDFKYPGSSRTAGYQSAPHPYWTAGNSPPQILGDQPPQVVTRLPLKHGLQDFLVPSIEAASSDVSSPRKDGRNCPGANDGSRVVDHRAPTRSLRQVIVIDDDSPQVKRRRLVREDDAGNSRHIPPLDYVAYPLNSYPDTLTLKPRSSVQSGAWESSSVFRNLRTSAQPTQGMSRDTQTFYTDPATGEQLPIYDAPESGRLATHPKYVGRIDGGSFPPRREDDFDMRQVGHSRLPYDLHHQRPVDMHSSSDVPGPNAPGGVRQLELYNSINHVASSFSGISTSYQPSRSYEPDPVSVGPNQAFIQSFSQSNLCGFSSNARYGLNVAPVRPQQRSIGQGKFESHQESSARGASPVRYMERPTQYRETQQQPVYFPLSSGFHAASMDGPEGYPPDNHPGRLGEVPTYPRTISAGRQIIYLE
ncbi:hypothetical protein LZ554_006057 [Drepanopeziza brunnea f. sp. 'monogermtubi']|nr:hypothetical protein LZ554_006057 [Drepanopeziza brunnea f. sp. 'monogermtubi']